MMRELGFCSGIENYSRHLAGREAGSRPWTLLDYFPPDWLLVVDESHMTIPQVVGMYKNDRTRKEILVDFGFRLPSALDNRPLTFEEFEEHLNQVIYMSATPGRLRATACRADRRAAHPADRHPRSSDLSPADRGPDRRPDRPHPRPRRARRARAGHDSHQEDGRGPGRLPARDGRQGRLPPLGGGHARAGPDPARPATRRLRRAGRHQPAARGHRPARGDPGRHPRRGQGGLPALGVGADPGVGSRRPQRLRARWSCTPTGSPSRCRSRSTRPSAGDATQEKYNAEHGIVPQTIVKGIRDINDRLRAVAEAAGAYDIGRQGARAVTDVARRDRQARCPDGGGDARRGQGDGVRARGRSARRDPGDPAARAGRGRVGQGRPSGREGSRARRAAAAERPTAKPTERAAAQKAGYGAGGASAAARWTASR